MTKTNCAFAALVAGFLGMSAPASAAPFKVFMIYSTAVDHIQMSMMARSVLPQVGVTNDFTIDFSTDNTQINDANLAKYDVFLQMHLAPFEIKLEQRAALENFVKSGKGWVGVHGAGLIILSEIGPGKALPDWPFFDDLIGHVTWIVHPMLQNGTVIMEDRTHPATRNMPAMFQIKDEWYEFSGNPRANVHVLGKADETSYRQVKPMGDHPMIWVCEKYPKAIYTATGHDVSDWQNPAFNTLIRDSLLWAAGRLAAPGDDGGADAVDGAADAGGGADVADAPPVVDAATDAAPEVAGTGGSAAGSGGATGSGGTTASGSGGAAGASGSAGTSSSGGGGCSYASTARDRPTGGWTSSVFLVLAGLGLVARRRHRATRAGLAASVALLLGASLVAAGCGSSPASGGPMGGSGGGDAAAPVDMSTTPEMSPQDMASSDVSAPADVSTSADADAASPAPDASDAGGDAPAVTTKIKVLAIGQLTENGQPEIHAPFVMAAKPWLDQLATETGMTVTYVESPNTITDALLANYNLILQLNYKPFGWNATAKAAFEKYLTEGRGGWVGLHHAGLYGPAVTQETWPWFFTFFGGINYKNYIATFVKATVHVEEATHPIFKGVPATFDCTTEEWYTWDKNPRPNVHVLANVDENSYMPNSNIKMGGDHPVMWTNDKVMGKNLYMFMGHHPNLFQNTAYTTLLRNVIFWAGTPK